MTIGGTFIDCTPFIFFGKNNAGTSREDVNARSLFCICPFVRILACGSLMVPCNTSVIKKEAKSQAITLLIDSLLFVVVPTKNTHSRHHARSRKTQSPRGSPRPNPCGTPSEHSFFEGWQIVAPGRISHRRKWCWRRRKLKRENSGDMRRPCGSQAQGMFFWLE